jgi:hypothetical protein
MLIILLVVSDAEGFEVFLKKTINVGQGGGVSRVLVVNGFFFAESGLAAASSVLEGEGELLGMLTKHPIL